MTETPTTPQPEKGKKANTALPDKTAPTPEPDVFALAAKAREGGKKRRTAVTITRAPKRIAAAAKLKSWFRTHPEAIFPGLSIFVDPSEEADDTPYFLADDVADQMFSDPALREMTGYVTVTPNGKLVLLLVKEADDLGQMHSATQAKHEAAEEAISRWTKMTWDASAREYDIAFAEFPQAPVWPEDVTLESVLRSAFGKSCIEEWDHPVLRRHRGEAL